MIYDEAARRDREDPLAPLREAFALPEGIVYLDGNSLGALPKAVPGRIRAMLKDEWGQDLIASWNCHGWIDLPQRVGERIAPLVGAAPEQVLCCDSISVNLFKLLATALALRPGRHTILVEAGDFPTDRYLTEGLAAFLGETRCRVREAPGDRLADALDDDVAVLLATEVNFRSGRRHAMDELTRAAHEAGALALWDLAHSAGAMPVALDACGVDLAVGCGYKFLNGGPGAPAFLYVARRHQNVVEQPLTGWLGHRDPFAFADRYQPAAGVLRYQAGTPSILALRSLEAALEVFDGIDLQALRAKSLALTDFFLAAVAAEPACEALTVLTPGDHGERGSQVSLAHPEGYAIAQALIEDGVIVDFRAPDIVRFGFAPLYNSFADAAAAARSLADVLAGARHRAERFRVRARVT
ncbi:kynureninase [Pseudohaliea rubra]|uniref:Kynureninase n=1 Tax=Pseudohaliea rubra DSM 19751 TaxID=1265313 RepID=A0A095VUL3_9GAMM|nr:kynureninase [Pseudohaliea rubra]KGE05107.1 Kynureninase [Pseudohaliea rubra DSM 19751]